MSYYVMGLTRDGCEEVLENVYLLETAKQLCIDHYCTIFDGLDKEQRNVIFEERCFWVAEYDSSVDAYNEIWGVMNAKCLNCAHVKLCDGSAFTLQEITCNAYCSAVPFRETAEEWREKRDKTENIIKNGERKWRFENNA